MKLSSIPLFSMHGKKWHASRSEPTPHFNQPWVTEIAMRDIMNIFFLNIETNKRGSTATQPMDAGWQSFAHKIKLPCFKNLLCAKQSTFNWLYFTNIKSQYEDQVLNFLAAAICIIIWRPSESKRPLSWVSPGRSYKQAKTWENSIGNCWYHENSWQNMVVTQFHSHSMSHLLGSQFFECVRKKWRPTFWSASSSQCPRARRWPRSMLSATPWTARTFSTTTVINQTQ